MPKNSISDPVASDVEVKPGVKDVRDQTRLPDCDVESLDENEKLRFAKKAQSLIEKDVEVQSACVTLLASYQLYNVALAALNRRIDDLSEDAVVERILIDSMRNAAGKRDISRSDVLKKIHEHVLPWIVAEIAAEREREDEVSKEELEARDEARRQLPVPLGLKPSRSWENPAGIEGPCVERTKSLVIAGHPGVVKFLLDKVFQAALRPAGGSEFRPSVLRLVSEMRNHNVIRNRKNRKQSCEVGVNRWLHLARSEKIVAQTLQPFVDFLRGPQVDLLVIDDLAQITKEVKGGANQPQARAGRGHRYIRKWADQVGCAVVAGLPFGEDRSPLNTWDGFSKFDETWTQMEIYTDLVQATVYAGIRKDTYSLCAMQHLDENTATRLFESIDVTLIDPVRNSQPNGNSKED